MPLPEAVKRRLRPLPQWSAVALPDPHTEVRGRLHGRGPGVDVTANHVVAALRPLTLAVGVDEAVAAALVGVEALSLRFEDVESGRLLGELDVRPDRELSAAGVRMGLLQVSGSRQRCVGWPRQTLDRLLRHRSGRRQPAPHNFTMSPAALQQLFVVYLCPRPVVLVSVDDGAHSNVFPMDLIGPLAGERFTLALRSTSQSVPTMTSHRRIALSNIDAAAHAVAYALGEHHRQVHVDWAALPFATRRSPAFALPVPDLAIRVREVQVDHVETIGSHTFFVTRVVTDEPVRAAAAFCHTSGIYQYFRTRQGRPLPAAR
jgi:flavin reductase (DIM6/NTAB) family NADH-FMN oxidoreductase RutF